MKLMICVIGMAMFLEGVPYFAFPDKMRFWIGKLLEMPDATLRKCGFAMMVIGLTLVAMARS